MFLGFYSVTICTGNRPQLLVFLIEEGDEKKDEIISKNNVFSTITVSIQVLYLFPFFNISRMDYSST